MRFPWIPPQEPKFFELFDQTSEAIVKAADLLVDLAEHLDCPGRRVDELADLKRQGDRSIDTLLELLGRTLLTPFEREDIRALARSLDDLLAVLDEAAFRLTAFRFDPAPVHAVRMALIVRRSCGHLQQAIHLCRADLGSEAMAEQVQEISRLGEEAAGVYRQVEIALFDNPPEIVALLKKRELYSRLRSAADACCEAANVVKEIVVKGS